jgi:hypothetical protein
MADNQGLGSDNMSQADKDKIHSMGGKASHSTSNSGSTGSKNTITNKSGGGRLTKEDQRKGGRN